MAAPHYVYFGKIVSVRADFIQDLLLGEFKRQRVALFPAEGAETAAVHANVRIVDMPVYDIVGGVSVELGPGLMGERSNGVEVRAGEKPLTLLK